jgi:hypothetical protein
MSMSSFTLVEGRWYAAEFIGDAYIDKGEGRSYISYSPIRVNSVSPLKTGRGELVLAFFHANYPEGVQGKSYHLRVVERQKNFLLAQRLNQSPAQWLLIYEVTWKWLNKHFEVKLDRLGVDIQQYMTRHCH